MITVAIVGLSTSVLFLVLNIFKDVFRINNLYLNVFAVICGFTYLLSVSLVLFDSIINFNYLTIAAELIYFTFSYFENNKQHKELKNYPLQSVFSNNNKTDLPKKAKYYAFRYIALVLGLLPFIIYLLTNHT